MLRTGLTNERTFIASYDSVAQGWLTGSPAGDEASRTTSFGVALARLRLETLLSRTLVMTDSQLLDGTVLRGLAGQGLLAGLASGPGGPLPVEVRGRAGSIEGCLWQTYVDDEAGSVRGFLPSGFSNGAEVRSRLLEVRRLPRRRSIEGVVSLLESVGVDSEELAAAEVGWRRLLELESSLTLKPWQGRLDTHFERAQAADPPDYYRNEVLGTDEGRLLFDAVRRHGVARGPAYAEVSELSDDDSALGHDAYWIKHWYDGVYLRSQALQHDADCRSMEQDAGTPLRVRTEGARLETRSDVVVELPAGTLTYLAMLPGAEWSRFREHRREWLHLWWSGGDVDALRKVLDDVVISSQLWAPAPPEAVRRRKGLSRSTVARNIIRYGQLFVPPPISTALSVALAVSETLQEHVSSGRATPLIEITDYRAETA